MWELISKYYQIPQNHIENIERMCYYFDNVFWIGEQIKWIIIWKIG